ncbi:C45 family autoproteolytic acyltransferase/hydolase [Cognataquiflexum aquatile]|uniref:C45 family autoproteolytic acyltransferase/hydolase n=1 Tax=Cognataquiflexum aquatile TaxID=2249427 RepID=UPI000DEA6B05|nr:C45 family peptidase [Cognataquiflexum aquatile]
MRLRTNKLFLFSLLVVLACGSPASNEGTSAENPIVNEAPKRELRQVTFSGSGYELGLQHGKYFKEEIGEIVQKWRESVNAQLDKEAEEVLKEFFAYADFDSSIKKWTPELYEEIRGIADGSGQDFDQIMVFSLLDEFWVYLNSLENHHCSNIGVPSVDGGVSYIAQNMDIESFTDGYQTLIRIEATADRPEQLVLSHPGLIALNGMNSSGVGMVMNTLMQLNASNSGLPVAFVVRKVLSMTDKDEIMEFITSVNHASGQNYILGVRGEVFNFEASANKVVRFDPGNKNQTVYHTNHPIVNDDVKPWFAQYDPKEIPDTIPATSNSYIRLAALTTRVADAEAVTDDHIKDALRSKDDAKNPVCRTIDPKKNGFTFASVVMTLTGEPYLEITAGPPLESDYLKVVFSN